MQAAIQLWYVATASAMHGAKTIKPQRVTDKSSAPEGFQQPGRHEAVLAPCHPQGACHRRCGGAPDQPVTRTYITAAVVADCQQHGVDE